MLWWVLPTKRNQKKTEAALAFYVPGNIAYIFYIQNIRGWGDGVGDGKKTTC